MFTQSNRAAKDLPTYIGQHESGAISETYFAVDLLTRLGAPVQANRPLSQVADSSSACFALSTIPYMWKKP